jgi:hypothetical protein
MSLKSILAQIQEQQALATQDTEGGNPATLRTRQGMQRQAKEQLVGLELQYTEEILNNCTFILVNGDAKESFADIAAADFGCFSADPEAVYKELANRVPPELYLGSNNPIEAFDVLSRHLEDLANELAIQSYPLLQWNQNYSGAIATKEDFVALVKKAINEQVGSELVGIYTISKLVPKAIAAAHASQVTPIILPTNDDLLISDLSTNLERFGTRSFVVTAGKTKGKKTTSGSIVVKQANDESVREALSTIRGQL